MIFQALDTILSEGLKPKLVYTVEMHYLEVYKHGTFSRCYQTVLKDPKRVISSPLTGMIPLGYIRAEIFEVEHDNPEGLQAETSLPCISRLPGITYIWRLSKYLCDNIRAD